MPYNISRILNILLNLIVFNFYPAEMLDKEALQQTTATHLAANEIEKLTNERAEFERELDIQVKNNYYLILFLFPIFDLEMDVINDLEMCVYM